jgi:hypothetical protein
VGCGDKAPDAITEPGKQAVASPAKPATPDAAPAPDAAPKPDDKPTVDAHVGKPDTGAKTDVKAPATPDAKK